MASKNQRTRRQVLRNQPLLGIYTFGTDLVQPFLLREPPTILGLDNVPKDIDEPLLWLPQHQSWADIATLGEAWHAVGRPYLRAIARDNYFPEHPKISKAISWAMDASNVFYVIKRDNRQIPEQESKRLGENRRQLELIANGFEQGYHGVILPEGTTRSNGTISPLRPGAYHIAKSANIPCLPVGNTYDFMAGTSARGKAKTRAWFHFGEPFVHDPSQRVLGPEFEGIEKEEFLERIRQAYIDLHIVTAGQLGGITLIEEAHLNESSKRISREKVISSIAGKIKRLKEGGQATLDPALYSSEHAIPKINDFYDAAQSLGYITQGSNGDEINIERLLARPSSVDTYRMENPLLYMTNKLGEVAQERGSIRHSLGFFATF